MKHILLYIYNDIANGAKSAQLYDLSKLNEKVKFMNFVTTTKNSNSFNSSVFQFCQSGSFSSEKLVM